MYFETYLELQPMNHHLPRLQSMGWQVEQRHLPIRRLRIFHSIGHNVAITEPWRRRRLQLLSSTAMFCSGYFWYRQILTDFSCEPIWDFGMTGHSLNPAGLRITPQRVRSAFSFEIATMLAEVL